MTDSQQAVAAPLAGGPDVPATCERPDHVDAKLRAAYAPGE